VLAVQPRGRNWRKPLAHRVVERGSVEDLLAPRGLGDYRLCAFGSWRHLFLWRHHL